MFSSALSSLEALDDKAVESNRPVTKAGAFQPKAKPRGKKPIHKAPKKAAPSSETSPPKSQQPPIPITQAQEEQCSEQLHIDTGQDAERSPMHPVLEQDPCGDITLQGLPDSDHHDKSPALSGDSGGRPERKIALPQKFTGTVVPYKSLQREASKPVKRCKATQDQQSNISSSCDGVRNNDMESRDKEITLGTPQETIKHAESFAAAEILVNDEMDLQVSEKNENQSLLNKSQDGKNVLDPSAVSYPKSKGIRQRKSWKAGIKDLDNVTSSPMTETNSVEEEPGVSKGQSSRAKKRKIANSSSFDQDDTMLTLENENPPEDNVQKNKGRKATKGKLLRERQSSQPKGNDTNVAADPETPAESIDNDTCRNIASKDNSLEKSAKKSSQGTLKNGKRASQIKQKATIDSSEGAQSTGNLDRSTQNEEDLPGELNANSKPSGRKKRRAEDGKNTMEGQIEDCTETGKGSKLTKFSHSSKRRQRRVEKHLLEIPDADLDVKKLAIKDLIRLAEAKEKRLKKAAGANINTSAPETTPTLEANKVTEDAEDDESTFLAPQVQIVNGQIVVNEESLLVQNRDLNSNIQTFRRVEETTSKLNYQTYMNRTPTERWTKSDTEMFYKAIQQFGSNFAMIQRLFPGRTRSQVKAKYKIEEKKHPLQLSNALVHRPQDLSQFQRVIDQLKISPQSSADQQKLSSDFDTLYDLDPQDPAGTSEGEVLAKQNDPPPETPYTTEFKTIQEEQEKDSMSPSTSYEHLAELVVDPSPSTDPFTHTSYLESTSPVQHKEDESPVKSLFSYQMESSQPRSLFSYQLT